MTPKPISFSSLNTFETCPRQFYEVKVAHSVVDEGNDAGHAGGFMHKAFEDYLLYGTELPADYPTSIREWPQGLKPPAAYKAYLDALKASPGQMYIEHELGITKEREPCAFDAEDVWVRGIIDVLHIHGPRARVLDHKTGKRKPSLQLKLNALLVFYCYPEVQEITTMFAWLVAKDADKFVVRRTDIAELWLEFMPALVRYREAFRVERFIEKPSGLCNGWCPVRSCDHWKPKRAR